MNLKERNELLLSFLTFVFLFILTVVILIWGELKSRRTMDKDEDAIHMVLEKKIPRF